MVEMVGVFGMVGMNGTVEMFGINFLKIKSAKKIRYQAISPVQENTVLFFVMSVLEWSSGLLIHTMSNGHCPFTTGRVRTASVIRTVSIVGLVPLLAIYGQQIAFLLQHELLARTGAKIILVVVTR